MNQQQSEALQPVEWQASCSNSGWRKIDPTGTGMSLPQRIEYLKGIKAPDGSPAYKVRALCASEQVDSLTDELRRLRALNAPLVAGLTSARAELESVLGSINRDQIHHDGDEFHERLGQIDAALAAYKEQQ